MKTRRSIYSVVGITLGWVTLFASNPASANGVYWSLGVSSPGVQVGMQNAPPVIYQRPVVVYPQPQVVYQQPQVVYQHPHVVYQQPQVVYQQPQVVYQQPQVVYVRPQPTYFTQPQPVYYGAPQEVYNGKHHPKHHGWYQGHGNRHHGDGHRGAVRISGHGSSDDKGRNHH